MRNFVVVGNLVVTTPDFSLKDIPGTSGRIDILCRCINSAFVLSHRIRRDVQVYLILRGGPVPKTVHLRGLRHLNPDATAALLKKALSLEADYEWDRSTPGIFFKTGDPADLEAYGTGTTYYLREDVLTIEVSLRKLMQPSSWETTSAYRRRTRPSSRAWERSKVIWRSHRLS